MIEIEVGREVDGRWIAEVPSLPGVLAYGSTEVEARQRVSALALHVVGDDARLDRPAVTPPAHSAAEEARTVAKAAIRAAAALDIAPAALAKILGLSQAGTGRLVDGIFELAPVGGPFVRAVQFVRAFIALDAITGGDEQAARSWLRVHNNALRDKPLELMQTPRGLAQACQYLDGRLSR